MRGTPLGIRLFTRPAVVVVGGAVWAASATWNTASDPSATCTTASFWSLLFTTVAKSSSSVTFTIGALPGGTNELYIGLSNGSTTTWPGNGADIGYRAADGAVIAGNVAITGSPFGASSVGDTITFDWSDGVNIVTKRNGTTLGTITRASQTIPASLTPTASAGNISGAQITLSGW